MRTSYQVTVPANTTSDPEIVEYGISKLLLSLTFPSGTSSGAKVQLTYDVLETDSTTNQLVVPSGATWFDWSSGVVTTATQLVVDAPMGIQVVNGDATKNCVLNVRGNP